MTHRRTMSLKFGVMIVGLLSVCAAARGQAPGLACPFHMRSWKVMADGYEPSATAWEKGADS